MKLILVAGLAIISTLTLGAKDFLFSVHKMDEKSHFTLLCCLLFAGYIGLLLSNSLLLEVQIKDYYEQKKQASEKIYNFLCEENFLLDNLIKINNEDKEGTRLKNKIKELYIMRRDKKKLLLN